MTLDEFRATAHPVSDETWTAILDGVDNPAPRSAFTEYGTGWVLHEEDGKFWPHAWWYSPRPHATRESAEADLNEWRKEFED
jgi:hypothetical protein